MDELRVEKIYNDAKDQYVSNYKLYADDTYLYIDEAKSNKANVEEVTDAFVKGLIVVVDGVCYIPVSMTETGSGDTKFATVTYVTADTTTPTTAVLATANSGEFTTNKKAKKKN